jgi:alkanesulfonate monooxygenase SsuD/methylene tetrahydromethanopterin reductase-like flavin-dependent oxidoreductase (luciferase family)
VVIQAGSSDRGKRFAARWAETVFVAYHDLASAQLQYSDMKSAIADQGHDPEKVTLNTIAYPVTAATQAEAEDKMALINRLYHEVDGLSLLSEALNFDFAKKALDEPFTAEELEGMSGMQAMRDRVVKNSGKANPTTRDFLDVTKRGRPGEAIVGSATQIADRLEQWFVERGCDGYVIAGTHTPGTFEDFVRFVVPELQRRGLFQTEYRGATLRENLGLSLPSRAGWRLTG